MPTTLVAKFRDETQAETAARTLAAFLRWALDTTSLEPPPALAHLLEQMDFCILDDRPRACDWGRAPAIERTGATVVIDRPKSEFGRDLLVEFLVRMGVENVHEERTPTRFEALMSAVRAYIRGPAEAPAPKAGARPGSRAGGSR